jgi:CelD/BcsL family acetyltransferase involved in cellulose biosynthesis
MDDTSWERGSVPLTFQLGDVVFGRALLSLYRRSARPDECPLNTDDTPEPPSLLDGADGYVVWSHPIAKKLPTFSRRRNAILYTPRQYRRFSIDLAGDFNQYIVKLSRNTRSDLKRKVRKFSEASRGNIDFRAYRTPEQLNEFFPFARKVSAKSYQERLLRVGLPAGESFMASARSLAKHDALRAYLLLLNGQPISYLYCPVRRGIVIYDHMGYDPAYSSLSPGTVLQVLALESLFTERRFVMFDFTEGEGQHKETFSTGSRLCADIYVIRRRLMPITLVTLHRAVETASSAAGTILDRLNLKSPLRKLLRSG